VGVFDFFSWVAAALLTVTVLWPLNVPLAVLAFRIHHGERPAPLEGKPLWQRAAFAALGLAGLSLALAGLSYLVIGRDLPPGQVHLVLLMAYVPVAAWYFFWIFALDEVIEGLSIFLIYVCLPGLPLLLLHWLIPNWQLLARAARALQVGSTGV
jgi:hypothetical protein